jgi:hypothetical protein
MATMNHDPSRSTLYGVDGESCPRRAAPTRRLERITRAAAALIATPARQVGPRRAPSHPDSAMAFELSATVDFDVTVN